MSQSPEDERLSDDLRHVADVLRDERPTLDPLALDRVKLRAMSAARRSTPSASRGSFITQRLATVLAAGFLVLGTGGTLALAGGGSGGGGSASFSQYKPPCVHGKGRGLPNECPGEKAGKGGQGGKGGKAGGGKGGKGKSGGGPGGKYGPGSKGGHGSKGGQGSKGGHGSKGGSNGRSHGGKGGKGGHGVKGHHGHKSNHGGKAGHGNH